MRGKSIRRRKSGATHSVTEIKPAISAPPALVTTSPAPARDGFFDAVIKRFRAAAHLAALLPIYALASACMAVAAAPVLAAIDALWARSADWAPAARFLALGAALSAGFFVFGLLLMLITGVVSRVLVGRLKPWRGPYYSGSILPWYLHNALIYLVRYSFLEFVTPTPLNVLYYRLLGMRVGEESQINTTHISDASLVELGDRVTLGGSATVVAHYGMGGFLVIAPVKIGHGATIGLKATIMGGVEIGEKAKVMPNSVVLPRTKIPAGETWGGVPARRIDLKKKAA